jgi:hypothetical protein
VHRPCTVLPRLPSPPQLRPKVEPRQEPRAVPAGSGPRWDGGRKRDPGAGCTQPCAATLDAEWLGRPRRVRPGQRWGAADWSEGCRPGRGRWARGDGEAGTEVRSRGTLGDAGTAQSPRPRRSLPGSQTTPLPPPRPRELLALPLLQMGKIEVHVGALMCLEEAPAGRCDPQPMPLHC